MRKPAAAVLAINAVLCAGCGARQASTTAQHRDSVPPLPSAPTLHARPQAVEPVAGAVAASNPGPAAPASVSVGGDSGALAQPVSDAQIRRELAASAAAGVAQRPGRATLTADGLALPPANAPAVIQQVITAGNQIAHLPYRFGGGHGTFVDNAYDCSGSLSYVFASAGLLNTTVDSGQLMTMGAPGPGKWITVFANSGHTFMYVAGLRFDTVALAEFGTRWSNRSADEGDLSSFVVRHPPGL